VPNDVTFSCCKCKVSSRYLRRADDGTTAYRLMTMTTLQDHPATRTYYCEHCGKANDIELRDSEWALIDL